MGQYKENIYTYFDQVRLLQEEFSSRFSLPTAVLGADSIQLYLETEPGTADYQLDSVSLVSLGGQDWQQEADARSLPKIFRKISRFCKEL